MWGGRTWAQAQAPVRLAGVVGGHDGGRWRAHWASSEGAGGGELADDWSVGWMDGRRSVGSVSAAARGQWALASSWTSATGAVDDSG